MKKHFGMGILRLFIAAFTAAVCLCSCDSAAKIADAVVQSAQSELSDAFADGAAEFSEGMDELADGLGEAAGGLQSAGSIVSEHINDIADNISGEIEAGLSEAADELSPPEDTTAADADETNDTTTVPEETTAAPEETTAAPEETTTDAPRKQYTFRNKDRYDEHYEKHGAEFGDITKEEYLELANELIYSESDRVLHKYSEDGDYMYFDQDTNYFLVLSEDGYIRTFFIPSAGIKYWERQ